VPHTVAKAFEILRERLEITPLQLSTVSKRHERVRAVLRKELPVLDGGDYLTGSYMRRTMIAPLKEADIDIFIVLDEKYRYDYNPASLLDKVKYVLKKEYAVQISVEMGKPLRFRSVTVKLILCQLFPILQVMKYQSIVDFPSAGVDGK
jgi:predicted nucleotidyltransferase